MDRNIAHLSWQAISKLVPGKIDTVILPVGTLEAHGAIPLGTDTLIPLGLSSSLADSIDALIAPPVWYGITGSLLGYRGSITLSESTFSSLIEEVCAGMAKIGFKKLIVMNGHGGQMNVFKPIMKRLFESQGIFSAVVHWWILCEDSCKEIFKETGGHAGRDEVAALMAYYPELLKKPVDKELQAFLYRNGIELMPAPGSIILYKEGEGYPTYDEKEANIYKKSLEQSLIVKIKEIFAGWSNIC